MHLGWGHQASLETIKIKEQLIFELYPEDSMCYVQGVMLPWWAWGPPPSPSAACGGRSACTAHPALILCTITTNVRCKSQTRCSRESLQLVVNGDLVQVAPVVPHLEPEKLFWSTFGYTLDIQDLPEVGAHVGQEHGQLCLHSDAGHQLVIILEAFKWPTWYWNYLDIWFVNISCLV